MKVSSVAVKASFDLSPLKGLIANDVAPKSVEMFNSSEFNPEIYRKMHGLNLLQAITPKEFGGQDLKVQDLVCVVRELAYGSPGVAATYIGNLLGYSAVVLYGNDRLRSQICEEYQSKYFLWSFGMTEGGCGSDLQKTATRADATASGFVLSGEKNFITNSAVAERACVFAQTFDSSGKNIGISCFYVPLNLPGVSRGEVMNKMGWRDSVTGTLRFDGVAIPENYLLGKPGNGLKILTHCLNRSKTLLGATGVGLSLRALDLVQARLSEVNRYEKPLIVQPAIRHKLAQLHTEVEAAWLLTCLAASTWDSGDFAVKEASMAKLFAGKTAVHVTSQCVELFGARGYFNDYEISRLWRDAKAIEIVEGPSLVQELLIAKQVLPDLKPAKKEADIFKLDESDRIKPAAKAA